MVEKINATPPPYIASGNAKKLISHFSLLSSDISFEFASNNSTNPLSSTGDYGIPTLGSLFATVQLKKDKEYISYEYLSEFIKPKVLVISNAVDITSKEIVLSGFSGSPGSYVYSGTGLSFLPSITSPYTGELNSIFNISSGNIPYTSSSGTNYKLYLWVTVNEDSIYKLLDKIRIYNNSNSYTYDLYFDKISTMTKAGQPINSDYLIGPVKVKRETYDSFGKIYPTFNIEYGKDFKFSSDGKENLINFTLNDATSLYPMLTNQVIDVINPFVPDGSSKRTTLSAIDIHKFIDIKNADWGISIPGAHTFVSELVGFDLFGFRAKTRLTGQQLNEKIPLKSIDGENELIIKSPIFANRFSSSGLRAPLKDVCFGDGSESFYWGQQIKIKASQGLEFGMDPEFKNTSKAVIHGLTLAFLYRAKTGTTVSQVIDSVSHGNYKYSSGKFDNKSLGLGKGFVTSIFASSQTGTEKWPETTSYREKIYEEAINNNTNYKKSYQYIKRYLGGMHKEESGQISVEDEYYWKAYDINGAILYDDAISTILETGYTYFFVLATLSHLPNTHDSTTEAPNGTSIVVMPISINGDSSEQGNFTTVGDYSFKRYCGTGHRFIDTSYKVISYRNHRWKFGNLLDYEDQNIGTIHNITSELINGTSNRYLSCLNDGTWQAETLTEIDGDIKATLKNGYPGHTKDKNITGSHHRALSVTKIEINERGRLGALYGNGFWNTDTGECNVKYILSYDRSGKIGPIEIPFAYEAYSYGYPIQKLQVKVVGIPGPAIWIVCTNKDTKFLKVYIPEDSHDMDWSFDSLQRKGTLYWGVRTGLIGNGLVRSDGSYAFDSVEIRDTASHVSEFKNTFTPNLTKDGYDIVWCYIPTIDDFKFFPSNGRIVVISGSEEQRVKCTYTKTIVVYPTHKAPTHFNIHPYAGPCQSGFMRANHLIEDNKEDFYEIECIGATIGHPKAHHDGYVYFTCRFDDHEICMPYSMTVTNDLGSFSVEGLRWHTDKYNKVRPPTSVHSDAYEVMPGELVSIICGETPSFPANPDILCAGLPRIGAKFPSGTVYFKTEDYETGTEIIKNSVTVVGDSKLTARVVGFNDTEMGRLFVEFLPGHGPLAYGPNITVLGKPKIEKILPETILHDGISVTINGKNFAFLSGMTAINKIVIKDSSNNYIGYVKVDTVTNLKITGIINLETGTHLYTGPASVVVATWTNSNSYTITIDTIKDKYGNNIYKNGNVYDILAPDLLLPTKVHNIFGSGAISANGESGIQNIKTPGISYSIRNNSLSRIIGNKQYNAIACDVSSSAKFPYTSYVSITDKNNVAKRFPQIVHIDTKEVFRDDIGIGSSKNFSIIDGLRSTKISWPVDKNNYVRRIPISIGGGRKVVVFIWKDETRFNDSSRRYRDYNSVPFGSKDITVNDHGIDITISTKFKDMGWNAGDWFYLGIQVDDWTYMSKHPAGVMTISPEARSSSSPFNNSDIGNTPVISLDKAATTDETEEEQESIIYTAQDNVQFVGTALVRRGEGFNYDYYIEHEFSVDNNLINIFSTEPDFIMERYTGDHPTVIVRKTSGISISREHAGKTQSKEINRGSESLIAGSFPLKMGPKKSYKIQDLHDNEVEYVPPYKNVNKIPIFFEDDGRVEPTNIDHIVLTIVGEFFTDKTEFVLVDAYNPLVERFTSTRILHIEPYHIRLSDTSNKYLDRKFSRAIVKFSPIRVDHYNDLSNMMTIYARNPDTQVGTLNQVYVIPHNSQSINDATSSFFIDVIDTNENSENFGLPLVQNPTISTLYRNEVECKSVWDSVPITNPFGKFRIRVIGNYLHGGFKPNAYILNDDGIPIVTGEVEDTISGINVLYIDFDASDIIVNGWYDIKLIVPYKINNNEFQNYEHTFDDIIYLDKKRNLPVEIVNFSSGRFQDKFYQDQYFMDLPGERFGSGTKYTVSLANIDDLIEDQGLDHGDIIQHLEWWLWHEDDTASSVLSSPKQEAINNNKVLRVPQTDYGPYSIIYVKNWVTDDNLSYGIDASLSSTPPSSGGGTKYTSGATTAIGNAWPVVEVMLEAPASFGRLPFIEFRDSVLDDGRIPLATADNVRRGLRDVTPYRFSFGFQRDDDYDYSHPTYPKLNETSICGVDRRKGAVSFRTPDCPEVIASGVLSPQENVLRGRGPNIEGIVVIGMSIRPGIEFRGESSYISLGNRNTFGYSSSDVIFRQSGAGTRAIGSFSYEIDESYNGIDIAILSSNEWTKRAIESLNPAGGDRDINIIKESNGELSFSSFMSDIGDSHSFGIDLGFNDSNGIETISQITGITADDFLKFYGPTEDMGALSDGILYRMRVIQSTEWIEVEDFFPGGIFDVSSGKWYAKAKPRGILAFGVNIISEGKDGLPVSKFYEVASAGLIDSLPAEDWYFVGGSADTKTVLELVDGKPEPRSVVKFRLFGAKYSNLTNSPDHFEQIFTLPTTYIEQPSIGGGSEYNTVVYNYRSVRGVMELSPSGESEPMGNTPSLDFESYGDLARFPICATPPYNEDSHLLQIPNKYWKFYVGRRPYDLIGTHIHDGIADYRNETEDLWPTPISWHSAEDKLGVDPFHGYIGELKITVGKGSTLYDAGNIAMSRQPINAELTNNSFISNSEDLEEIWPSNAISNGDLKDNTGWSEVGFGNDIVYISDIDYDQSQFTVEHNLWYNSSTGSNEFIISDAPGFDNGFYRIGSKVYTNNYASVRSSRFRMDYDNLYRLHAMVRPTFLKFSGYELTDSEIFVAVVYQNSIIEGKLDGLGNTYQSGDSALWDPIGKKWISFRYLANYSINIFHFMYFYGTLPNPLQNASHYSDRTYKFTNLHNLSYASLLPWVDSDAHKLPLFSSTEVKFLPSASIAFDVGLGDEYPGLDLSMVGAYNDNFRVLFLVQSNVANPAFKLYFSSYNNGGIWDIGNVSVRHKTLVLAQEMKGYTVLSLDGESADVQDLTGGTASSPVLGSQSIIIRDNPAFVDWMV